MGHLTGALTPGEWVAIIGVTFAALAYGVRESLDLLGRSPSSRRLREENTDLIRRNRELEDAVARHEQRIAAQDRELAELRAQVRDLQKADQRAVLDAIAQHEASALVRHESNKIAHDEAMDVWRDIRDTLKEGASA